MQPYSTIRKMDATLCDWWSNNAGLNLHNCMGYEDCVALKSMFLAICIPIVAYFMF